MDPILVGKAITTADSGNVFLLPKYANRHGLVAGATGTGKTVTLMTLAEGVGRMGVTSAEMELIRLLDDERPGVRRAAARGLGRLRAERALERLEVMAQSEAIASAQLAAAAAVWRIKST